MKKWNKKGNRFVLFLDILGFKDLVARQSHEFIVTRLKSLTDTLGTLSEELQEALADFNLEKDQIKSVTFSDSIIVFTKGSTLKDAASILSVAHAIFHDALLNNIPIKGAISIGEITVDFEKSLFFGQPIIDAYILHEELGLLSIILDHNAEIKFSNYTKKLKDLSELLVITKVPMKFGKVNHTLIRPSENTLADRKADLKKLYESASGKPRLYIDNTYSFFDSFS